LDTWQVLQELIPIFSQPGGRKQTRFSTRFKTSINPPDETSLKAIAVRFTEN